MSEVRTRPDAAAVACAAAELFVALANDAVDAHRSFNVALSGGSTPKLMFALLATPEFGEQVNWGNIRVFWSDERTVPPDHEDSNYRTARETLLHYVPIPDKNVHRIRGENDPHEAAQAYERTLRETPGNEQALPRLDLIYLGMGSDGHTASLFPHTKALDEKTRLVVANYVDKLSAWRVTFTAPLINAAAHVAFLVTGADKAERLNEVLNGTHDPKRLPSQLIQPEDGQLLWLVDEEAAKFL